MKHLTTVLATVIAMSLFVHPGFAEDESKTESSTEDVGDGAKEPDAKDAEIQALKDQLKEAQNNRSSRRGSYDDLQDAQGSIVAGCREDHPSDEERRNKCVSAGIAALTGASTSSSEGRCSNADGAYENAKREFGKACPDSGFDTQSTEGSGQLYCSAHVACCMGSTSGGDFCEEQTGWYRDQASGDAIQDALSEMRENLSNADSNVDPLQITQWQNQSNNLRLQSSLLQCPQKARVGLQQAIEDADAAREKLEEKQERLAEMREELALADVEVQEAKDETNAEITAETKRARDAMKEINDGLQDQEDRIADEIKRLTEDIVTAGEDRGRATRAIQNAQSEKVKAEDEIYISCLTRAEELIQARRAACVNAAANVNQPEARERSQGCSATMTEIFKQQGMSLIERMQTQVDEEIETCLKGPRATKQQEEIERLYKITIDDLYTTIEDIGNRIQLIEQDIEELQTDDRIDAYQEQMEQLEELEKTHQENMDNITAKGTTNVKRAEIKKQSIEQKIRLYLEHVQNAQEGLSAKQAILNSRQSFAGGDGDVDSQNFAAAQSGYYSLISSTNRFIGACCDDGDLEARVGEDVCKSAREFSKTHGGTEGVIRDTSGGADDSEPRLQTQ